MKRPGHLNGFESMQARNLGNFGKPPKPKPGPGYWTPYPYGYFPNYPNYPLAPITIADPDKKDKDLIKLLLMAQLLQQSQKNKSLLATLKDWLNS